MYTLTDSCVPSNRIERSWDERLGEWPQRDMLCQSVSQWNPRLSSLSHHAFSPRILHPATGGPCQASLSKNRVWHSKKQKKSNTILQLASPTKTNLNSEAQVFFKLISNRAVNPNTPTPLLPPTSPLPCPSASPIVPPLSPPLRCTAD